MHSKTDSQDSISQLLDHSGTSEPKAELTVTQPGKGRAVSQLVEQYQDEFSAQRGKVVKSQFGQLLPSASSSLNFDKDGRPLSKMEIVGQQLAIALAAKREKEYTTEFVTMLKSSSAFLEFIEELMAAKLENFQPKGINIE